MFHLLTKLLPIMIHIKIVSKTRMLIITIYVSRIIVTHSHGKDLWFNYLPFQTGYLGSQGRRSSCTLTAMHSSQGTGRRTLSRSPC